MKQLVEIVYRKTGKGLQSDGRLLALLFESMGYQTKIIEVPPTPGYRYRIRLVLDRIYRRFPALLDVSIRVLAFFRSCVIPLRPLLTIQLQSPIMRYFGVAHQTWLIPNQEWFREARLIYLPYFDVIMCKTEVACNVFSPFHNGVRYTGFSGEYVFQSLAEANTQNNILSAPDHTPPPFFVHVAGKNRRKGSRVLVDAWRLFPGWPKLVIIADSPDRLLPLPDNVEVRTKATDSEIKYLQEHALAVLAPSEVEGFGHTLLEAMSRGALGLTSDAPPMNEIVTASRGMLVKAKWARKIKLGDGYDASQEDLISVIESILSMSEGERSHLVAVAQQWVCENHNLFERRLKALVSDQLPKSQGNS